MCLRAETGFSILVDQASNLEKQNSLRQQSTDKRAKNPLLDPGVLTEGQSIALASAERTGTGDLLMINILLLWKSLDWATLELAAALEERIKTAESG